MILTSTQYGALDYGIAMALNDKDPAGMLHNVAKGMMRCQCQFNSVLAVNKGAHLEAILRDMHFITHKREFKNLDEHGEYAYIMRAKGDEVGNHGVVGLVHMTIGREREAAPGIWVYHGAVTFYTTVNEERCSDFVEYFRETILGGVNRLVPGLYNRLADAYYGGDEKYKDCADDINEASVTMRNFPAFGWQEKDKDFSELLRGQLKEAKEKELRKYKERTRLKEDQAKRGEVFGTKTSEGGSNDE